MHIFLQGERGVGKSHLIQEVLRPFKARLAGYQVQRLFENGELTGFRAQNVRYGLPTLDAYDTSCSDGMFLHHGKREVSVLEGMIVDVEQDSHAPEYNLILLDEIGGMELCSDIFMDKLYRILSSEKPCIGVFKSAENLAHMAQVQQLDERYCIQHRKLEEFLCDHGELFTLTKENREQCKASLAAFLSEKT